MTGMLLAAIQIGVTGHVAALLFGSGLAKFGDPARFRRALADYRLLPDAALLPVAAVMPWIEIVLAAALVGLPGSAVPRAAAALLLVGFGGAIAINLARGRRRIDCGCGTVRRSIGWPLVARNMALAWLVAVPPVAIPPLILGVQAMAAGIIVTLLAAALPHLKEREA